MACGVAVEVRPTIDENQQSVKVIQPSRIQLGSRCIYRFVVAVSAVALSIITKNALTKDALTCVVISTTCLSDHRGDQSNCHRLTVTWLTVRASNIWYPT